MTASFSSLSDADLRELVSAIKSQRISAPYSDLQVNRVVAARLAPQVAASLREMARLGFAEPQIITTLEVLISDRSGRRTTGPTIDLVTSGPEAPGVANRDTAVVVRELFAHARTQVLVVGYAVYQGASVFEALARRMEELPELGVKLFLNIARADNDRSKAEIVISRYAQRFRESQWPKGCRLPEVFYDPRSTAENKRSSLHAKCVVVDNEQVFVSSANFTKAGQERNIEVGLKIDSSWLSQRITEHFEKLHQHGLIVRAF